MEIFFKKEHENARIPVYGSRRAAGADLSACIDAPLEVPPGETVFVPSGISAAIPDGYAGFVFARSGLASKRGLAPANKVSVIDSDYRGEIIVPLHNHGPRTAEISPNERIAQLVIIAAPQAVFREADTRPPTERGTGGFGATGACWEAK